MLREGNSIAIAGLTRVAFVSTAVLVLTGPVALGNGPVHFMGLGDLPGGGFESTRATVSADGSVVAGIGRSASGLEAFRWTLTDPNTLTGVMEGLGDFAGGAFYSAGLGISADGLVIVGDGQSALGKQAFRWTEAIGMLPLISDQSGNIAYATNADGSMVTGQNGEGSGQDAFCWEDDGDGVPEIGETQLLPDLPGGGVYGNALAISDDGSVIVGHAQDDTGPAIVPTMWTRPGNDWEVSPLEPRGLTGKATDVSPTGSAVVGYRSNEAFRWTQATGMVGLGDLEGGSALSVAYGVSADGSVVVGVGSSPAGEEAIIWDETYGMRNLRQVLNAYGVDLTDWTLSVALGISDDGRTIVGRGINPDGNTEAWIALIPEPAPLLGDLNDDGVVGQTDLNAVLADWGHDPPLLPFTDPSGDGMVSQHDLDFVLTDWGKGIPPGTVPEPATLGMFALCGLALFRRKPTSR